VPGEVHQNGFPELVAEPGIRKHKRAKFSQKIAKNAKRILPIFKAVRQNSKIQMACRGLDWEEAALFF
jgi:hypothetical protein